MKSTRLKNSSRAFLLIRFGDTDSILSCTASLLPTLPLSSPLQARSSSLLQLPLSRALLARWAWPPPFLNVRIQVWQNSSRPRPAFARTCFCSLAPGRPCTCPESRDCEPAPRRSGGARSRSPAARGSPAARRDGLPAPGRARCHGSGRGRRDDPPQARSAAASRPGRGLAGRAGGRINVHSINPAPRSRWLLRLRALCVCVGAREDGCEC